MMLRISQLWCRVLCVRRLTYMQKRCCSDLGVVVKMDCDLELRREKTYCLVADNLDEKEKHFQEAKRQY